MTAISDLFRQQIFVINVGLELFAQELEEHRVPVIRVAWSPPAGGDLRKVALLDALADEEDA